MLSIVLLGTGNVARHLFDAFLNFDEIKVAQVVGRNQAALQYFEEAVSTSTDFKKLAEADIYIIAISDDAVAAVSEDLAIKNMLLVHTSGSVDMSELSRENRAAVFYPLQSFSKDRELNFKDVPICIEAERKADLETLKKLAAILGNEVFLVSSEQRRSLHLAAVFVNNFVNHLYTIGHEICLEQQLPFSILKPLILETCKKIEEIPPLKAQTGPAMRNDLGTMEKHKDLLQKEINKKIYSLLSASIQETYGKKL